MFTEKDIEMRSIFVINCIEKRHIRVCNGELLLEEELDSVKKTLTKMPFQKILLLFIVGHISITTALLDKCKQYNVSLVVVKPNLRPIFYWSHVAEANFLLRQKQYNIDKDDIGIAKHIVKNKIANQLQLLKNTRKTDEITQQAKECCINSLNDITDNIEYYQLMGIEGNVAKNFFRAYFQQHEWSKRLPRIKSDFINASLDIGYTILFNYIECFVRMFGFDLYIGVYHRLWFKRKSLICDLMEPFRCIIERTLRNALNRGQIKKSDFMVIKNEYKLKKEYNSAYQHIFFEELIKYKSGIFKYIQQYYRAFMRNKDIELYPNFNL